jgi:peptidoglycan/xylan/chitin deacetylase (PgdA/CDA1 family)
MRLAPALALTLLFSGALASPTSAAVPILTYHRVGTSPRLERQVAALARSGYEGVTLGRVWQAWRGEATLPRRPVVLSFDDGYLSQYGTALPVLRARGWPGVLNLEVARLGAAGGLRMAQVRRMIAAGWEIDAHTLSHPDLTAVGAARLRREVAGSGDEIAERLGVRPAFFCYPYGHVDARVEAAVRAAGYLAATTTRRGLAARGGNRFALPRISVSSRTTPRALLARIRAAGAAS